MDEQKYLDYINPATGEQFGQIRMTTPDEITAAHRALKEAFQIWSAKSKSVSKFYENFKRSSSTLWMRFLKS
jgi:acyl-CoA reductase-like NAD-dependent aldehyde dehydrogenase